MDEKGKPDFGGRRVGVVPHVRLKHAPDHAVSEVAHKVVDERQNDRQMLKDDDVVDF